MPKWGISFWVVGFVVGIGVVGRVFVGCCSQWIVAVACCSYHRMTVGYHSWRCASMDFLLAAAWCSCCHLRYEKQSPLRRNGQHHLFRLAVRSKGWIHSGVGLHCRRGCRESVHQYETRVLPCRRYGECFLCAGGLSKRDISSAFLGERCGRLIRCVSLELIENVS